MEKKYDTSEVIKIVDKAFIIFEEKFNQGKSEKNIDDSDSDVMVTLIKFAIMGEIMNMLKEGE